MRRNKNRRDKTIKDVERLLAGDGLPPHQRWADMLFTIALAVIVIAFALVVW